jgi:hypothetical protein
MVTFDVQRGIVDLVVRYLVGELTFEKFEEKFVTLSRPLKDHASSCGDLVYAVELALAEFSCGHWTETELKQELANSLRTLKFAGDDTFGSSDSVIRGVTTYQESSIRTRPATASV